MGAISVGDGEKDVGRDMDYQFRLATVIDGKYAGKTVCLCEDLGTHWLCEITCEPDNEFIKIETDMLREWTAVLAVQSRNGDEPGWYDDLSGIRHYRNQTG